MLESLPIPPWMLGAGAVGLVLTALLLSREINQRELAKRAQRITQGDEEAATGRTAGGMLLGLVGRIGNALRGSFFFAERDIQVIERTARAAGMDAARAVPLVLGMAIGTFMPNWLLALAIRTHQDALRKGLPDALDLLVVCAEAGLGLESALERVAVEMQESSPALSTEFTTLLADMRLSNDRRAALTRLGERTGLVSFQRLGGTLSQTLRYGTPIGQALRVLAAEMRTERMIRIEEKAARLPALLVLPMILFILPCLFIVLGGPAAMRILDAFYGPAG